jgi:hypothetical protein
MEPFQRLTYDEVIRVTDDSLDRRSEAVANFAFPGLTSDHRSITGYYGREGINTLKNQLKTHYEQLNKKIATDILKIDDDNYDLMNVSDNQKTVSGKILKLENLKHFSIKFYTALTKLNKLVWGQKGAKTAFIYSNLVKVGIELFQEVLIQNGYLEFDENPSNYKISPDTICYFCGKTYREHKQNKIVLARANANTNDEPMPIHEFYPAVFISITGKSSEEVDEVVPEDKKQTLDNVFSILDNREGKNIKFVLGSKVMSEAISLKNVGEVHILDVHYNLGKVDQVIGRAIRHCSHYGVINDKNKNPEVKVYKYAVSLGANGGLSSEEDMYKKAELKYILIKKVERILKEVAIDCSLNRHGNLFPEEMNQYKDCTRPDEPRVEGKSVCPAICDYTQCHFKCDSKGLNDNYYDVKTGNYKKLSKGELDRSTFTQSLAKNEIETVKGKIKDMYRVQYVYTLKEIVKYVKNSYEGEKKELFEDFFVFKALDDIIPITENDFNNFKDTVFDKFNRPGYLLYVDKYYIFQPFDQNEDVPMYYRSTYDKRMQNTLSLYNYIKNTPKLTEIKDIDTRKSDKSNNDSNKASLYDFESTMEYYDNRDEFAHVGIIDKEPSRRKNKQPEELQDTFKIREKRDKILDKKRGTGIASIFGAVCETSKSREYLADIAKSVNIKLKGDEIRSQICVKIKERLLFLEKYSTTKKKNKVTYVMIPANHKIYKFPYNLEDRKNSILDRIKDKIKFKIDMTIKDNDITVSGEKVTTYEIIVKVTNELKEYKNLFEELGFTMGKDKWTISIN